ncbi:MAG: glutaredoxin [Lentimonas sp.]|jgi:glutaredoxin
MGVRAIMKKYDLEYEDRDIINNANQYAEMVEKSGQPLSPCVEIAGHMLADVSGDEVESYMLEKKLVATNAITPEVPTNAACTDEEHEAMRSKTVRFF